MSKGSKSSKKEVSRSLTKKWVKKEVKKGQESYHRSRMGQTKEVKIGQNSYQKGGLIKNGSKRRSKRVKRISGSC